MKVVPALVWNLEGDDVEALDPRLMPLLRAIAASASLVAAVAACGISYRAAWGLLRDYQHKLGAPLVLLERGRGASLTPSGERLIGAARGGAIRGVPAARRPYCCFSEQSCRDLVSIDFFVVPTVRNKVLFVLVVLAHHRRRVVHFNVTEHPTAQWTGQQIIEAFPGIRHRNIYCGTEMLSM